MKITTHLKHLLKMENYTLNENNFSNLFEENESEKLIQDFNWLDIESMEWYQLTRTYGNNANDKLREFLIENDFSAEKIAELKNFIVEKRSLLQEAIKSYVSEFGAEVYFGDDTLWDVTAHIVGMGKTMYEFALNNPQIINIIISNNDYVENFEYAFDSSVYDINYKYYEEDEENLNYEDLLIDGYEE